jgi:hypothetical protein
MLSRIRARLTYANLTATVALVVALGGTAYAAATIGSKDVINDSLKSIDLKDEAGVTGEDVKDGSLAPEDIGGPLGGDIVARATGDTDLVATDIPANYPLSGNTWTQASDESNFFFGRLTVDPPPTGCAMTLKLFVDGQAIDSLELRDPAATEVLIPRTEPFSSKVLFEPDSPEAHTITVEVVEDEECIVPWVVTSLQVNVLGVR